MTGLQPFDPWAVVMIAALNPVVAIVGVMMGRNADQWQKLLVAGFAAALAGSALVWVATFFRLLPAKGIGGETGVFVLQIIFGVLWAALGYYALRRRA